MLRISAGQFKGLGLITPRTIRATESRVRQALFNILGEAIQGARVLDGCAGSGSLGFEALSRGAAFVAFVESDAQAILSIHDNMSRLGIEASRAVWRLVHLDLERGLKQLAQLEPPFDVILIDPPYRSELAKKALNTVVECAMLAPTGLLVMEHERRETLPVTVGPLKQIKQHRYGDTVLSFYQATS